MTRFNLALAMHLVGAVDDSVRLALDTLLQGESSADPGFMWLPAAEGLEFARCDDLLDYGEELVRHIMDCPGTCALVPAEPNR